jgi:hypothetical protein
VDAGFVVRIVGPLLPVKGTQLGAVNRETIAMADSGRQLGTVQQAFGTSDGN